MKQVYDNLLDFIRNGLETQKSFINATKLAADFIKHTTGNPLENFLNVDFNITLDKNWQDFNDVMSLYCLLMKYPEWYDWNTERIGSFYVGILLSHLRGYNLWTCKNISDNLENIVRKFHQLYTVPEHGDDSLSLPEIAYLYSLIDFKFLGQLAPSYAPVFGLHSLYLDCVDDIIDRMPDSSTNSYYDQGQNYQNQWHTLPCMNLDQYPKCVEYCNWHQRFFNNKEFKKDFLTIMRYAQPYGKIMMNPIGNHEQKLAEKLFGKNKIKSFPEQFVAPMSMVELCHRRDQGFTGKCIIMKDIWMFKNIICSSSKLFTGDDIGLAANVCNAFFPTPTDVGLCLTKDLDIKTIAKSNDLFDFILEPEIQSRPQGSKIEGGTYWTESTLILYTEAGNSLR